MDKEILSKRIKLLDEIESLKRKCKCSSYNINCENCLKIKSIGDKLISLTARKDNKVNILIKKEKADGVKTLEIFLTVDKYINLKNSKLTDTEIASIYNVNEKAILLFKRKHNIKVKRVYKEFTAKEIKKVEKIIKKEKEKYLQKVSN